MQLYANVREMQSSNKYCNKYYETNRQHFVIVMLKACFK